MSGIHAVIASYGDENDTESGQWWLYSDWASFGGDLTYRDVFSFSYIAGTYLVEWGLRAENVSVASNVRLNTSANLTTGGGSVLQSNGSANPPTTAITGTVFAVDTTDVDSTPTTTQIPSTGAGTPGLVDGQALLVFSGAGVATLQVAASATTGGSTVTVKAATYLRWKKVA